MNTEINHITNGGGLQAPKGGIYVTHKIGDVAYYKGGQFLPEGISTKQLTKEAPKGRNQRKAKPVISKNISQKVESQLIAKKEIYNQAISQGYEISYKAGKNLNMGKWFASVYAKRNEECFVVFQFGFNSEKEANEALEMSKTCFAS